MKNKLTTIFIISATIILAGIAVFTAIRLYQLRQVAVAPNVPESEPAASEARPECDADIILTIDRTNSMTQADAPDSTPKIDRAKEAAKTFLNAMKNAGNNENTIKVGLVTFHPGLNGNGPPFATLDFPLTSRDNQS
jgi:hypothetical protein